MAGNRLLHGPRVLFLTVVVSVCFFAVFVISIVEFSSSRPTDRPTDWTEALCGRAREREGERGRKREGKRGTRGKDRKERGGERERESKQRDDRGHDHREQEDHEEDAVPRFVRFRSRRSRGRRSPCPPPDTAFPPRRGSINRRLGGGGEGKKLDEERQRDRGREGEREGGR